MQLKKEQERRTELADREGILRTKAMREREEQTVSKQKQQEQEETRSKEVKKMLLSHANFSKAWHCQEGGHAKI